MRSQTVLGDSMKALRFHACKDLRVEDVDVPKSWDLLASGKLPVQKAITGKGKLENAVMQGFDALTDPNSAHLKILVEVPS